MASINSPTQRGIFRNRPAGIRSSIVQRSYGNQKFQPLPAPMGQAPYHLSLDSVLTADQMNAVNAAGNLSLHIVGDTGGVKYPLPQQHVADAMEADFGLNAVSPPSFLYHLGDAVYFFGEASEYYSQFYEPYVHYPAPIFAIPGNHDGDVADPTVPSLVAFVNNFCAQTPHVTSDAGDSPREAMTQPNVYWTLETPFATFIGLYSNVPEGGQIHQDQIDWFIGELRDAAPDNAVIVSVHHPPFSADSHHAGSVLMVNMLDNAFKQSGRTADIVFTGHVHNYQRFTRRTSNRDVPYIVAGAGGYWHLHAMQTQSDGSAIQVPFNMPESGVTLENYCDNRHGYMKVKLTKSVLSGEYYVVPAANQPGPAQRIDSFQLDLQQHKVTMSTRLPLTAQ